MSPGLLNLEEPTQDWVNTGKTIRSNIIAVNKRFIVLGLRYLQYSFKKNPRNGPGVLKIQSILQFQMEYHFYPPYCSTIADLSIFPSIRNMYIPFAISLR